MKKPNHASIPLALISSAALLACGGGGGAGADVVGDTSSFVEAATGLIYDAHSASAPQSTNASMCDMGLTAYCGVTTIAAFLSNPSAAATTNICKEWSLNKLYSKGTLVLYQGKTYQSTKDVSTLKGVITGSEYPSELKSWQEVTGPLSCPAASKTANTATGIPIPTSFEVSYTPPVGDQKNAGTCNAFATGYAITTLMNKLAGRVDAISKSDKSNIISTRYLFTAQPDAGYSSNLQNKKKCSGSLWAPLIDANSINGAPSEKDAPYFPIGESDWEKGDKSQDNCLEASIKSNPKWNVGLDKFKVRSYRMIDVTNVDSIKTELRLNNAISFGTSLPSGFYWVGWQKSFYGKPVPILTQKIVDENRKPIDDPHASGHAMLIVGYDDTKNAFKVQNSWGVGWGDAGYIWVDYGLWKSPDWTNITKGWWKKGFVVVKEDPTIKPVLKSALQASMKSLNVSSIEIDPSDANQVSLTSGRSPDVQKFRIVLDATNDTVTLTPAGQTSRSTEYSPTEYEYTEVELLAAALKKINQ